MLKMTTQSVDFSKIGQGFERLPDQLKNQGRNRALLRAVRAGRSAMVKSARSEFRIKSTDIKTQAVSISAKNGVGSVSIKGTRFNLGYFLSNAQAKNFTAKGNRKKGLKVAVKTNTNAPGAGGRRASNAKTIQGAFTIAREKLKSNAGFRTEGFAVFVRRKSKKGIRQLFSVSAPEMLNFKNSTKNTIQDRMREVFQADLNASFNFYVSQIMAGQNIGKKSFKFTDQK